MRLWKKKLQHIYPYLKARHLLFLWIRVIAVNAVPHTMSAGPSQSPDPLPHQGPGVSDPPQSSRGPDLPLPQCSSTWHAMTMTPYLPREAQVGLRS